MTCLAGEIIQAMRLGWGRLTVVLVIAAGLAACTGGHATAHRAATTATTRATTSTTWRDALGEIHAVDAAPSCSDAVTKDDPNQLVSAFRASRLVGSGAEPCMAERVAANYCDTTCVPEDRTRSPGPICLYRCFGFRIVDMVVESLRQAPDGHYAAYLEYSLRNARGQVDHANEVITIGRGMQAGTGKEQPLLVLEATTSA